MLGYDLSKMRTLKTLGMGLGSLLAIGGAVWLSTRTFQVAAAVALLVAQALAVRCWRRQSDVRPGFLQYAMARFARANVLGVAIMTGGLAAVLASHPPRPQRRARGLLEAKDFPFSGMQEVYFSRGRVPPTFRMERADHLKIGIQSVFMDKYEATVQEYRRCVEVGVCETPASGGVGVESGLECNYRIGGRGRYPMNCVSGIEAKRYCEWLGKRLPHRRDYEAALVGYSPLAKCVSKERPLVDGSEYGPNADKGNSGALLCPSEEEGAGQRVIGAGTVAVGSLPQRDTWDGIADLFGSVCEWSAAGGKYEIFCGHYYKDALHINWSVPPKDPAVWIGLRCAVTAEDLGRKVSKRATNDGNSSDN